jgi:hypothetical protein
MPKAVSALSRNEQPLNWGRAVLCGIFGSWVLMSIIDICAMMGITHFCMETYVGSILRDSTEYSQRSWVIGFFANWVIGGLMGLLYAFAFESIYQRANGRVGTALGLLHTVLAGVAIFPFLEIMRSQMHLEIYPGGGFGFFGAGIDAALPVILLVSHLAFGACMGTFYGPVRSWRVRARDFEPGEHGLQGERGVKSHVDDPHDRIAIGYN